MNKKQLFLTCAASLALAAVTLTGCGDKSPDDDSKTSSVSSEISAVNSVSQEPEQSTTPSVDLDAVLDTLTEAAALGGTINVSEIDLKASGVDMDNVEAFAGAESQLSVENGGIVMVIQAAPGTADAVKTDLESFRDTRASDDRYAEFEQARLNTENARIVTKGDLVLYAVSAEGDAGLDKLDAAIAEISE